MHIEFIKVIIHNFLSFGHAEIDLKDRQYCMVSGINQRKKDASKSNGSGKSSWSSAICWALTGETIQGITSGIKNDKVDEDLCYVTLFLNVDGTEFEITRSKAPKTNLTIKVNGEDKSGKTFRESEAILESYLPDLTSQLIGSIIILGQGLPSKFSSNTPSGRKEVLEKLSKSDFMIQDIKTRLAKILSDNQTDLRKFEDTLLALDTKLNMFNTQYSTNFDKLNELEKPQNFDARISELTTNIDKLNKLILEHSSKQSKAEEELLEVGNKLNSLNEEKTNQLTTLREQFKTDVETPFTTESTNLKTKKIEEVNALTIEFNNSASELKNIYTENKTSLTTRISAKIDEITKIENIKEFCPTCGQKLINVVKPNPAPLKLELEQLNEELSKITNEYNSNVNTLKNSYQTNKTNIEAKYAALINDNQTAYNNKLTNYNNYVNQINDAFKNDLNELNAQYKKLKDTIDLYSNDKKLKEKDLLKAQGDLIELQIEKENHDTKVKEVKDALLSIDNNIKKLNEEILYNNNEKNLVTSRIDVDNKLNTLIKRDFRGFLLSNVINFIDSKAKEYSMDIFGHNELEFKLDGNNIDIMYSSIPFENLSGGEKQKVDLIIQFAIRDMMSQYLDFSSNILVLDEIFDQLDIVGCTNVLNLISTKLNDIESMFIISHRADELSIPYDSEMVIIKNELGVSRVK